MNGFLELEHVTKVYPGNGHGADNRKVLDQLSLTLAAGETLAVVGPSGCGKSTLLNLIGALDRPTSGTIRLADASLNDLDQQALARFRNRQVGLVFQDHHLLPQCSVWENALLPTLVPEAPLSRTEAKARAEQLLDRVGLIDRRRDRPNRLSGGERQRVAVVRALMNRPPLLLADEPTGSLDEDSAGHLTELLLELNREENVTLIVVTHSMSLARAMNRVLRLSCGILVGDSKEA